MTDLSSWNRSANEADNELKMIRDLILEFACKPLEPKSIGGTISSLDLDLLRNLRNIGSGLRSVVLLSESEFPVEALALTRRFYEWSILESYLLMPGPTLIYELLPLDRVKEDIEVHERCNFRLGETVCTQRLIQESSTNTDTETRLLRNPAEIYRSSLIHRTPPKVRKDLWQFNDYREGEQFQKWFISHNLDHSSVVTKIGYLRSASQDDVLRCQSHFYFLSSFVHAKDTLDQVIYDPFLSGENSKWVTRRVIDLYVISVIWMLLHFIGQFSQVRTLLNQEDHSKLIQLVQIGEHAASELGFPFARSHEFEMSRQHQENEVKRMARKGLFSGKGVFFDYDYIDRISSLNIPRRELFADTQWSPVNRIGFDIFLNA